METVQKVKKGFLRPLKHKIDGSKIISGTLKAFEKSGPYNAHRT